MPNKLCKVEVDNVRVKPASRSFYRKSGDNANNNEDGEFEEALPGMRSYMMEAIISLDKTLADIECSGGTISGEKSEFLMDGIKNGGVCVWFKGKNSSRSQSQKNRQLEALRVGYGGKALFRTLRLLQNLDQGHCGSSKSSIPVNARQKPGF